MQPLFERGIFFFNEAERNDSGTRRLIEKLLMFEKGTRYHDDGPDAIEGAVWMLNYKTRIDVTFIIGKRNTGTYCNIMRY
jgi:hypothetical protein